jgi:hypothetical protein
VTQLLNNLITSFRQASAVPNFRSIRQKDISLVVPVLWAKSNDQIILDYELPVTLYLLPVTLYLLPVTLYLFFNALS